jgi:hypothetical protein
VKLGAQLAVALATLSACGITRVPVLEGAKACAPSAPKHVQGGCTFSSAPATSVSFTSLTAHKGAAVLVGLGYAFAGESVMQVTDTLGTTYAPLFPLAFFNGQRDAMRVFAGVLGEDGTTTVTATLDRPQADGELVMFVHEYSGVGPLDRAELSVGSSNDVKTASVTTEADGELLFAYVANTGYASAGVGFTQRATCLGDATEDAVAGPAGPYAATFVSSMQGVSWAAAIVTYRPATCLP